MERFRVVSARAMFACCILAAACVAASNAAEKAEIEPAELTRGQTHRIATLRERLIFGLQARLKSEVAFVDEVIDRVKAGELPRRMVDQTFFWARDRSGIETDQQYQRPIIYFRPAMTARAKKLGIVL